MPWEGDPEWTERLARAPAALSVPRRSGGTVLATAIRPALHSGWLLWVETENGRAWSDPEAAALTLAGHALGGLLQARGSEPALGRTAGPRRTAKRPGDGGAQCRPASPTISATSSPALSAFAISVWRQTASGFAAEPLPPRTPALRQNGAQLTHLLRLFSRRQAGSVQPVELPTLIAEEAARATTVGGQFTARATVADDLPPVAVDAGQLRQVLAALLENARDALEGAGTASVSARPVELTADDCLDLYGDARPGPHVEIAVADSGPGLPPEAARGLFSEPFFTAKPRHRGFGLAVTYGILHAHHGGLCLKPGPSGGTVAAVYLPCAGPSRPAPAAAAGQPKRGERVLVVDDDAMILRFICATLEQAGYRVQAASGAEEAVAQYTAAASDRFRLVLADVFMPKATGVDLARRLLGRDPDVRFLFMSGKLTRDFDGPDFAGRGFEFLSKPFRTEGLLRAVRGAIDRAAPSGVRPASL